MHRTALVRRALVGMLMIGTASCAYDAAPGETPGPAPIGTELAVQPVKILDEGQLDWRTEPDPANVVYATDLEEAKAVGVKAYRLPRGARRPAEDIEKKEDREFPPLDRADPRRKINPILREKLAALDGDERVRVMLVFNTDKRIPLFPEPPASDADRPPEDRTYLRASERLIARIQERSLQGKGADAASKILQATEAEIIEQFWLIDAVHAEVTAGRLLGVIDDGAILAVDPVETDVPPPFLQNADNTDDVQDGRAIVRSDPYFNLGLDRGFIGLLDTGIRDGHDVFASPDNVDFLRDCVGGGANCRTGSITTADLWPHGTASGAIISAGNGGGGAFRGVTDITLDSFRIYGTADGRRGGLNVAAAVRGFQQALAVGDRIIVGEIQLNSTNEFDTLAVAADAAFDAGAVVVAANGNNPAGGTSVSSPAIAHKAIGTGRTDIQDEGPHPNSLRGPTPDGRVKPDVHAPSNTETARGSGDSSYARFNGTSGATPYASGVAALFRNWLRGNSGTIDPGQVNAFMILAGRADQPINNTNGAGMLEMPLNGRAAWGKTFVSNREDVWINMDVPSTARRFDAAIWWPEGREGGTDLHSDIDLALFNPSGTLVRQSIRIGSVWERVRIDEPVAGRWRIRIRGFRTPRPDRPVYWAAHWSRSR